MLPTMMDTDLPLYLYSELEMNKDEEKNWLVDEPKEITTSEWLFYYAKR